MKLKESCDSLPELMLNKMDRKAFSTLFQRTQKSIEKDDLEKDGVTEESGEDSGSWSDNELKSPNKEEKSIRPLSSWPMEDWSLETWAEEETFAGKRILGVDTSTIKSSKGSIRGVKNRVRAGIDTFLHIKSTKTWQEKEVGQVIVYTTTMGVIRETYQRCLKVRHILRTHLIKYIEKDVFMSREVQSEIKERMGSSVVELPQVFVEGVHLGDADVIEKLNETGDLRKILKPYKNPDVCTTCTVCGGYQLLPCGVCNGSKKSVHRNHFNSELIALKCMNCDEVGLVRCYAC